MGTAVQWVEVFLFAGFWCALMTWINLPIESEHRRRIRYLSIQVQAVGGFFVGLVTTFGLRSFRWPLLAVTAPTLALTVIMGKHFRKRMAELKTDDSTLAI